MVKETFWGKSQVVEAYRKNERLFKAEECLLNRYFREGMAVLDLGCGAGRVSSHMVGKAGFLKGIDIDPAMLEAYRQRCPGAETQCISMGDIEEATGKYDLCLITYNSIDCLEPKAARIQALAKILSCLKPGGMLIFSSHNPLGDFGAWMRCAKLGTLRSIFGRILEGYSFKAESYVPERLFSSIVPIYYGRDFLVKRDVESLGYEFVEAIGAEYGAQNPALYRWFEYWIYYVFRKPVK